MCCSHRDIIRPVCLSDNRSKNKVALGTEMWEEPVAPLHSLPEDGGHPASLGVLTPGPSEKRPRSPCCTCSFPEVRADRSQTRLQNLPPWVRLSLFVGNDLSEAGRWERKRRSHGEYLRSPEPGTGLLRAGGGQRVSDRKATALGEQARGCSIISTHRCATKSPAFCCGFVTWEGRGRHPARNTPGW